MHNIQTQPGSDLIEVEIAGFWTLDEFDTFASDLRTAAQAIRASGRTQSILYDYTHAAIQSQAVVAAHQDLAQSDAMGSRRVALYSEGRLARMQARRIAAVNPRFAVFEDRPTALAWLNHA